VDGLSETRKAGEPAAGGSGRLVLLARIALLTLAGAAVVSAIAVWRGAGDGGGAAVRQEEARWVCPMHPDVTARAPGACPICGMALREAVAAGRGVPHTQAEPASAPRIDTARRRTFTQEIAGPAWVEPDGALVALLYDDEIGTLTAAERGAFFPAGAPDAAVAVERVAADTPLRWDRSTARVRFRFDAAAPAAPGTHGWIKLPPRPREVLVIPASALLDAADGPHVLVDQRRADGQLERRAVAVGRSFLGLASVVSGLHDGERVVARNAFFLDVDQRLRAAATSP
jgi:hypothetical protein